MNVLLKSTRGVENSPRPILMSDLGILTMVIVVGIIWGGFGYLIYRNFKKKGEDPSSDDGDLLAEEDVQDLLDDAIAAAVRGDPGARCKLGVLYAYGAGVPQDVKTAVKWYTLAADQGDAEAQFNLGGMYENGKGVPQNYETAVEWYTLAAEQGNLAAEDALRDLAKVR